MENAEGDYVVFLDGDDYVSPDFAKSVVRAIDNPDRPDVICWRWQPTRNRWSAAAPVPSSAHVPPTKCTRLSGAEALVEIVLRQTLSVWTGSAAYKSEMLKANRLRYTVGCHAGEDREFIYSALAVARTVEIMDDLLSFYYVREGSITNSCAVRKFDSVYANLRAAAFLEAQESAKLVPIAVSMRAKSALSSYFRNLNACMSYRGYRRTSELLKSIRAAYPSIEQDIRSLIVERWKVFPREMGPGLIVCLVSPRLHANLTAAQHRMRAAISRRHVH